jgi:hypothetical protein
MGNFKHQPLRGADRDRETEVHLRTVRLQLIHARTTSSYLCVSCQTNTIENAVGLERHRILLFYAIETAIRLLILPPVGRSLSRLSDLY